MDWIKVNDRYPKDNDEYLVYIKGAMWSGIRILSFTKDFSTIDDMANNYYKKVPAFYELNSYGYTKHNDVTHWMPLPKPPED